MGLPTNKVQGYLTHKNLFYMTTDLETSLHDNRSNEGEEMRTVLLGKLDEGAVRLHVVAPRTAVCGGGVPGSGLSTTSQNCEAVPRRART